MILQEVLIKQKHVLFSIYLLCNICTLKYQNVALPQNSIMLYTWLLETRMDLYLTGNMLQIWLWIYINVYNSKNEKAISEKFHGKVELHFIYLSQTGANLKTFWVSNKEFGKSADVFVSNCA